MPLKGFTKALVNAAKEVEHYVLTGEAVPD